MQIIIRRVSIILATLITVTGLMSQPVFAISSPQSDGSGVPCAHNSFFSSNDILFYCDTIATCEGPTAVSVTDDNTETILRYFTGKGFSLAAAAGVVGNLHVESGLNPAIIQGGRIAPINKSSDFSKDFRPVGNVGFGIAQWTTIDRQSNLVHFVHNEGKHTTDLVGQLDFMWKELNDSYKNVITSLLQVKDDPVVAAIRFHGMTPAIRGDPRIQAAAPTIPGYEGSADTADMLIKNRGGYAKSVYSKYHGTIPDGNSSQLSAQLSTGPGSPNSPASTTPCSSTAPAGTTDLGQGTGQFKDGGQVNGYQTVLANAKMADQAFGSKLVWSGLCLAIVSDVWNGQTTFGSATATSFWMDHKSVVHTDKSPKVGSVLLFGDSNPAGHIVIYLGNNKVLNDGHIDNATVVGRGFNYRGWLDPNDIGWKARPITSITKSIRPAIVSRAGYGRGPQAN